MPPILHVTATTTDLVRAGVEEGLPVPYNISGTKYHGSFAFNTTVELAAWVAWLGIPEATKRGEGHDDQRWAYVERDGVEVEMVGFRDGAQA